MSDVSCNCTPWNIDDNGSCEVSCNSVRKARKEYRCEECDSIIKKGDRYEYNSSLWEGEWRRTRTCLTCARIAQHYCPGGYFVGQLAEAIEECLDFDYRQVPEEE